MCVDVEHCQNLLEKPTEREYYTDNAVAMVQCKVLKQLQLLEGRKIDDQDIVDDVNFLNETLQASVQDLRFVACSFFCRTFCYMCVYQLSTSNDMN